MSLALSIHLLEGLPPIAGARTLPVAVGVHATKKVALAGNVKVISLGLLEVEYGWCEECAMSPAGREISLRPGKVLYLVEDLVDHTHDSEVPLPAGRFTLEAHVFAWVAKCRGEVGDPDEEPEYGYAELRATRLFVIEQRPPSGP